MKTPTAKEYLEANINKPYVIVLEEYASIREAETAEEFVEWAMRAKYDSFPPKTASELFQEWQEQKQK